MLGQPDVYEFVKHDQTNFHIYLYCLIKRKDEFSHART